jgi:hypothetical protein
LTGFVAGFATGFSTGFSAEELETGATFALEELEAAELVMDELETGTVLCDELEVAALEIGAGFALEELAVECLAAELEVANRSLPFSSTIRLNCFLAIFTMVNLFWMYPPRLTVSFSIPISFARWRVPERSSTSTNIPSGSAKAAVKANASSKKIFFIFYLK